MKRICTAVFLTLLSMTMGASEIPDAIRNFYAAEQQQYPGEYAMVVKFSSKKKNGEQQVCVLISCRQGTRWRCRNRLDCFRMKDNRILGVRKRETLRDFWSAAAIASDFLWIEAAERGEKLSFFTWDGEKTNPRNEEAFRRAQVCMREPGRYVLPLPNGIPLPGISRNIIEQFQQLPAADEAAWLRERLSTLPPPAEAINLLKRLEAIGEFVAPMEVSVRRTFQNMLLNEKLGNAPRHLLFSLLLQANFIAHEEFVTDLLADPLLGERTLHKLLSDNRDEFRQLVLQWSGEPGKQSVALRYSEELVDEPGYCSRMLAAFPEPSREQLFFMIPVYAKEVSKQGDQKIKRILTETPWPGNYQLLCQVAEWILKTEPDRYVPEIKNVLFRERNNPDLKRGILYPLFLAALCKANDRGGIALTLRYLGELESHAEIENAKRIWGQEMTGTVTIDRIIAHLEKAGEGRP